MTCSPLIPYPNFGDISDTRGRTPVDPTQFKQPKTLVLLMLGQSMWGNFGSLDYYAPGSGRVFEFNPFDGKIYPCDGWPVLGANGWPGRMSITPYLGDMIVGTKGWERVLLCNMCVGGTSAVDWCPIGQCFPRFQSVMRQLCALEIVPNYLIMCQGQQDCALNTDPTNYTNLRVWGVQGFRGEGYAGPIVFGLGTHWTGIATNPDGTYTPIGASIRQAQLNAALIAGVSAGADDDGYGDNYRVDGVHWNSLGRYYTVQAWLGAIPMAS